MKNIICLIYMGLLFINCNKKHEINTITTKELKGLLDKEKIQLLDVRTFKETKDGNIENSLFVNYFDADFAAKSISKLNLNKPVYLICRSGNRSVKAAIILKEKGFEVYSILGGYTKWKKENKR